MADCDDKATIAVLVASDSHTDGAIECARCAQHVTGGGTVLASKPLILRPEWTG